MLKMMIKRANRVAYFCFWIFVIGFIMGLYMFNSEAMAAPSVWQTADSYKFAWDPVTKTVDNMPIDPTKVEYIVYIADEQRQNPILKYRGTGTSTTITFDQEGKFLLGVKAVRVENGNDVAESAIQWSDDPAAAQGGVTFGVIYYAAPEAPGGLRKE